MLSLAGLCLVMVVLPSCARPQQMKAGDAFNQPGAYPRCAFSIICDAL